MKKPTKNCIHAQQIIKFKRSYSKEESADGCWTCGGPLVLEPPDPVLTSLDEVSMSDEDRQKAVADPKEKQEILDCFNQDRYYCDPCMAKFRDEMEADRLAGYPGAKPMEEVMAYFRSEVFAQEKREELKSILECGPECPAYQHVPQLQKDYGLV
jgi:hypothetical protein